MRLALMAGSPFDSAWLKWGRAVVHAQAVDRDLGRDLEKFKTPYTSSVKYDAKHHCMRLVIDTMEPLPPTLGLVIGDMANNFRAALDHLAWALVTTRGKRVPTAREESRIYFPIALTRKDFAAHFVVSQFLRNADKAIVRAYQPYIHGKRKVPYHCLTSLPRLNSDDKHRMLRAIWSVPQGGGLRHGPPVDCSVTRIPTKARAIVLEPGAEIQRIYVRRTGPNPDMYMEADLTVMPTLDGLTSIKEWVNQTTMHLAGLLFQFGEPPEEIRTLGIIAPRPIIQS